MRRGLGYGAALIVWLAISAAVYIAVSAHEGPAVATIRDVDRGTGEIVIQRSRDGHYYVEGSVNDHPIVFMIDTGASVTSIGRNEAIAAGLPKGAAARFRTAGGDIVGEIVSGVSVEVAGIRVDGLRVAIMPGAGLGEIALLGQNFLRRLDVTQRDDRLLLRLKRAS